uniref:Uncharacterized protein n=1 Tax=Eutreptiella gymnastica TaxID=73025 RepID=A0A7S1J7Z1_9EUGL|mmetsp:Transcript_74462/g.131580  ORF Transcript_74462/g.131580 Transcript_74462/m.131580 type:complete len:149 (+) Transcript_74462:1064-1510(+)
MMILEGAWEYLLAPYLLTMAHLTRVFPFCVPITRTHLHVCQGGEELWIADASLAHVKACMCLSTAGCVSNPYRHNAQGVGRGAWLMVHHTRQCFKMMAGLHWWEMNAIRGDEHVPYHWAKVPPRQRGSASLAAESVALSSKLQRCRGG